MCLMVLLYSSTTETFSECYAYGLSVDWLNSGLKEDILPRLKRLCELREGMIEEMFRRAEKPSA